MEIDAEKLIVNGIEYTKADLNPPQKKEGMKYVIVRSYGAGVFAGWLEKQEGKEVTLIGARRIWYWDGAASLSQLAMEGTKKPENCKFPCEVDSILLTDVCEILSVTDKAKKSISGVKIWKQ